MSTLGIPIWSLSRIRSGHGAFEQVYLDGRSGSEIQQVQRIFPQKPGGRKSAVSPSIDAI